MSIDIAIDEARNAWECNTSLADRRWRLKQLHGLKDLLLQHRDEIVLTLTKGHSEKQYPAIQWELELAMLFKGLAKHIKSAEEYSARPTNADFNVHRQPTGVCLIIFGSENPLRFGLAPLAACIAAGNTVVIGNAGKTNKKLSALLARHFLSYLDSTGIHWVPNLHLQNLPVGKLDRIFILDDSSKAYSAYLSSSNVKFCNTTPASNIAVVDKGPASIKSIVAEVFRNSGPGRFPTDTISAMFVRQDSSKSFLKAVGSHSTDRYKENQNLIERLSRLGITKVFPSVYLYSTVSDKLAAEYKQDLEQALDLAQSNGLLLVIEYTSMDRVLDLIRKLQRPVRQIVLFASPSTAFQQYVEEWVQCEVLSFDKFRPGLEYSFEDAQNISTSASAFRNVNSLSYYSQHKLVLRGRAAPDLSSIAAVRASYQGLIPPLKPEPRGERTDFFTQVGWVVKGVAGTVGLLTISGLFYGSLVIRKRFF